jgi:cytochrome bd-type quinol oxidase subunit 2
MSLVAAIRPDEWNFSLFFHVLGAMVLVGSLVLASTVLAGEWREGSAERTRLAFKTLLIAVLPAWLVTRIFAQIIADKEGYSDADEVPAWIDIGFMTTEPGLLLLVGATVATGLGARRATRAGAPVGASRRVAAVLVWLMTVLYVVAVWAMTAKPD